LKPAGANRPLPGVIALHEHDGVKFFGKEKIADGRVPAATAVEKIRADLYEGRAFANELDRQGFVVLAHDVFLCGSRRFPFEVMPESIHRLVENWRRSKKKSALEPTEVELYEVAAQYHTDRIRI
jgi:dienelactone hydrolase